MIMELRSSRLLQNVNFGAEGNNFEDVENDVRLPLLSASMSPTRSPELTRVISMSYDGRVPPTDDPPNNAIGNSNTLTKSAPYTSSFNLQNCESTANILEKSADTSEKEKETSDRWKLYLGLFYAFLSSLFFSACSVIVKYMTNIHPGELAIFRFVGIFVFTVPLIIHERRNPTGPPGTRILMLLRGIMGATSLFLRFYALRYLPIADASVIIFSVPVVVSIFARICLGEPCGVVQSLIVVITMLGLLLMIRLPEMLIKGVAFRDLSTPDQWMGIAAAISSTFFGAAVYVLLRKLKHVPQSIIMFNFGWVAILETTIITAALQGFSAPSGGLEGGLIFLLGLFSFFGQMLLTTALKKEYAGPVSVVRAAADIVFAFIWELLFFKDIPDVYTISGAGVITSCVILTGVRKWALSLPEDSRTRKRLYILTL